MGKRILGDGKAAKVSKDGMTSERTIVLMLPLDMPETELRHVAGSVFDLLDRIRQKKEEKKKVTGEIRAEIKSLEEQLEAQEARAAPYQQATHCKVIEDHRAKEVTIQPTQGNHKPYSRTMTTAEAVTDEANGEDVTERGGPPAPPDEDDGPAQAEAITKGRAKTPTAAELGMPK